MLAIFTDAQTRLRKPTNLKALTGAIDGLDWFSAREEGLGNLYEGLLEKNAADQFVKLNTNDLYELTQDQAHFQRHQAYQGLELVPDTHRLCLMNLMLHGIEGGVGSGDSLSPDGEVLGKADVILTRSEERRVGKEC